MDFGERLKILRGDLSQKEFARKLGFHFNTIGRWERGDKFPDQPDICRILSHFPHVNPTWFTTGEGPMRLGDLSGNIGDKLGNDVGGEYVKIPRYAVAASAGAGAVVHSEQVVDFLSFRAEWVRNTLGVSVRDLALISVIGDSMEPTLSDGDVVLLDMTTRSVLDGSIYALQLNGGLLVKRIQRKLDGSVVVKSDNPRYDPEVVSADQAGGLKIVGRVVWVGRRL